LTEKDLHCAGASALLSWKPWKTSSNEMKDDTTNHDATDRPAEVTMVAQDLTLAPATSSIRASLVVLAGWEIGHEIDLDGRGQILGRSSLASHYINAPSVSRQHARIDLVKEADREVFSITDLKSSNGTRVNGEQITAARLHNGDRVRLGDVLFKFVLQDEIEAQYHQQVHRLIHYDQLTGLMTMEAFRHRLDAMIRRSGISHCFSIAMTDLDGLKRVNDTYGHLAGRMVVREMGSMIRATLREEDIAALYGGDETVVLFSDAHIEEAREVAEKLRLTIEQRAFEHQGHSFQVSISQGLAEWPRHGSTAEDLISAADLALYAAKAAGRNRVCLAEDKEL
jgi:diguanylate cyclase (GGDEF)-like protein